MESLLKTSSQLFLINIAAAFVAGCNSVSSEATSKGSSTMSRKPVPSTTQSVSIEQEIQDIVRADGCIVATPSQGPWAGHDIILVPRRVSELYAIKPRVTIDTLSQIVQSGSVKDALTAAGFAIALLDDPAIGYVACRYPAADFDKHITNKKETRREYLYHLIKKMSSFKWIYL